MTYTARYENGEITTHKTLRSAIDCARSKMARMTGFNRAFITNVSGSTVATVEAFGTKTISKRV